ncbi:phage tail protein [Sphingomonas corticis]|jgi:hypothetical protein|uniref:Tip attachment protein J domain-containing protein n=1 Tax=Sphingomonas corticis TaxID=2722791 RepID=A0ABX1CMD4_9SPHN|nr:phage tail protein [Sphingomonas corticis]NJR77868.1 hypothetical protein [Sphingomonas corticis]
MATLVLTTVGGAIGGPIGAALGALAGQAIDRRLLAPPARQGPRLTELALQTSTYGTQIPRVFGTMRVAGTVIWSTDLIETRARRRGGKGQPATASYSYAASFAVALSARPVLRVGRIWADGKLLRGAAGDWKSATGFRLHRGDEDQAADPLIASLSNPTPAHRGIAYAVFEELQLADFGNRIPSLTFEVTADERAVPVGAIARELGAGAIVGEGPTATVDGFAAAGSGVAGALETLAQAAGAWFVPQGGGLAMRDAAAGPATVLDADVAQEMVRGTIDAVPLSLSLSHYDAARDYQIGRQLARRPGAGHGHLAIELPAALSAAQARRIADAALLARETARVRRRVTADIGSIGVAPGDPVRVAGETGDWRVTQASVEGMQVTLDLVPVAAGVTARPADAGRPILEADHPAGRTVLEVFELPPLDDALPDVPQLLIAAAGTEAGWRGAALSISRDGIAWEDAGATAPPAIIGMLDLPVRATTAALTDHAETLTVVFAHDDVGLEPAGAAALAGGANLALLGDELIQFADAARLSPRRWRLSGLWRGRRGTAVAAHDAGARFVLIERATLVALPLADASRPVSVSASGIGDGVNAATRTVAPTRLSVAPPAPVHLRAHRDTAGGLRASWIRRSRRGWRWEDGVDVPLVEERETYRVVVDQAGTIREWIVDTPAFALAAGGIGAGPATVSVRQIGTLAPSPAATITI